MKRNNQDNVIRYPWGKQRGSAPLIGIMLALGIMATLIPLFATLYDRWYMNQSANAAGKQFAEYAVAVQAFIAEAQNDTSMIPGGTVMGTTYLKSTACGGPHAVGDEFIPCSFGNYDGGNADTLFGGQYRTTFNVSGTAPAIRIEVRTDFMVTNPSSPAYAGTIAQKVVNAAEGSLEALPTGTFATYLSNVPRNANGPVQVAAITGANRGRVLGIFSNDSSNDLYLRVDGTNEMRDDLDVGGNAVVDSPIVTSKGAPTVPPVAGAVTVDDDLIVEDNQTVIGDSAIFGDMGIDGGLLIRGQSRHGGQTTFGESAAFDSGKYLYIDDVYLRNRNQWLSNLSPRYVPMGGYRTTYNSVVYKPICRAGGTPKIWVTPGTIPDYSYLRPNSNSHYRFNHRYYAINYGGNTGYWRIRTPTPWGSRHTAMAMTYCHYP